MQLNPLYHFIETHTGLKLDERRQGQLQKLFGELTFQGSINALIYTLERNGYDHPQWQAVLRVITVGETYFFRNRAHMNALQHHVLPNLIAERRKTGQKQLRFWSAGCATGEEPYTLSMLLDALIPDIDTWSISILATDINTEYLEYAKRGVYHNRSFRLETPDFVQGRWFEPDGTGSGYKLKQAIRNRVVFRPLNLVSDLFPSHANNTGSLDLILCRNVTIYFEMETTTQIISRFYEALNPEGWLVIGHSEPQLGVYDAFMTRNFENAIFYQKSQLQPTNALFPPHKPSAPPRQSDALAELKASLAKPRKHTSMTKSSSLSRASAQSRASKPAASQRFQAKPERKEKVPAIDRDAMWQQAWFAANQEKWDETLDLLDQMNSQNRFQPQVHYLYALVFEQQDQEEKALKSLQQAIYCDRNFALGHYSLGEMYAKRKQKKEALHHWRLASKLIEGLDPTQLLPHTNDLTVEMLNDLLAYQLKLHGG